MDPRFASFEKFQEVGFSSYLGFIPILNVLLIIRFNEAVRGRWIGPKTWDRIIGNIFFAMVQPKPWVGAVWIKPVLICGLNGVLVCIGPEMAVKSGLTK